MINNNYEIIDKFCNKYYEVGISFEQKESGVWSGEGLIQRRDTNESVKGSCYKIHRDKNKIRQDILDHFDGLSDFFLTTPDGWNKTTSKVLANCLKISRKEACTFSKIENLVKQREGAEIVTSVFNQFCKEYFEEILGLIRQVENLSKAERKEILLSDEVVYQNLDDLWVLDDFIARNDVFSYFINPSDEEIRLHQLHTKKGDENQE